jgi:hypothetical protein
MRSKWTVIMCQRGVSGNEELLAVCANPLAAELVVEALSEQHPCWDLWALTLDEALQSGLRVAEGEDDGPFDLLSQP